jgi:uncharacterized protein (DUF2236 family)
MESATPAGVDLGLFGPGSIAWRVHCEPAMLVGGLRALMVQALHPQAIAAVADHSSYRSDVFGRFMRTTDYVLTTIFGTTLQAEALGARVRRMHRAIRGVDPVTGRPYAAGDPELLLWIHATLVESFLAAYRRFVGPLEAGEADRFVAELVRQAQLVGLHPDDVPPTEAAIQRLVDSYRPILTVTRAALEAVDTVLHPPLPAWGRPFWWLAGQATISLLPDHALSLLGLRRSAAAEAVAQPLVRCAGALSRPALLPSPVVREAYRRAAAAGAGCGPGVAGHPVPQGALAA